MFKINSFLSLVILSLLSCTPRDPSQLKQVKIQVGQRNGALLIRAPENASESDVISSLPPEFACNRPEDGVPFLPENFDPKTASPVGNATCPVYGYTKSGHPVWKSQTKKNQAILLDNKRFQDGLRYPVGVLYAPSESAALTVNVCTAWQVAEDKTSEGSCLAENKDFFANETQGLAEDAKAKRVGRAIVEALQILTYTDQGLAGCYEEALLETDAYEGKQINPFDEGYNLYRSLRRRDASFPATEDELNYLSEVIAAMPEKTRAVYRQRYFLAKRLGYNINSQSYGNLLFAYEPLGVEHWETDASGYAETLRADFGDYADILARLPVQDGLYKELASILNRKETHFILARGAVSDLKDQPDAALLANGDLSKAKLRLWGDLIYRAVLLAKTSGLEPQVAFDNFRKNAPWTDSCTDYADYKPGRKNKRDQLVRAFAIAAEGKNVPSLAKGEFPGHLIDSYGTILKPGNQPFVLHRSVDCVSDANLEGYCPVKWESLGIDQNRYKSLFVRVTNQINTSFPEWTSSITRGPLNNMDIISGAAISQQVKKGLYGSEAIAPVFSIEGVFDNGQRDLIFSSKLARKKATCGSFRPEDSYVEKIHGGERVVECSSDGTLVTIRGTCESQLDEFNVAAAKCVRIFCVNGSKEGGGESRTYDGRSWVLRSHLLTFRKWRARVGDRSR